MSRTVSVKSIKIASITALTAAVAELKTSRNVQCELVSNARPRLWGGEGSGPVCEHVLRMPGRFDIGFKRQQDGTHEMICDQHGGELAAFVGNSGPVPKGATREEMQLGYLSQLYGKHLAIEVAVNNGYPVSAINVLPDGSICVEANVMQMQA